jgi:hypothetical protein
LAFGSDILWKLNCPVLHLLFCASGPTCQQTLERSYGAVTPWRCTVGTGDIKCRIGTEIDCFSWFILLFRGSIGLS